MEDVAILTGGTALFESLGRKLESVTLADLGRAKKIVIDKDTRRSSKAPARAPRSRAASSSSVARSRTPTSDYDREKLEERLAKLAGGVAR